MFIHFSRAFMKNEQNRVRIWTQLTDFMFHTNNKKEIWGWKEREDEKRKMQGKKKKDMVRKKQKERCSYKERKKELSYIKKENEAARKRSYKEKKKNDEITKKEWKVRLQQK